MTDTGTWPSVKDIQGGYLKKVGTTKVVRANNPLMMTLRPEPINFQRFTEAVNGITQQLGGITIELPKAEQVKIHGEYTSPYNVISVPYTDLTEQQTESLRGHIRTLYQIDNLQEGEFPTNEESEQKHRFITGEVADYEKEDPSKIEGFIFRPVSTEANSGLLEIRHMVDSGAPSETEMVYETAIVSLILAGRLDMSTPEEIEASFPFRRALFMHIYHDLLDEMLPLPNRKEIYGLDDQIGDIATNLYGPLAKKAGHPMNTLLVGAPGTGKTFVGSYFASLPHVLTVPMPIGKLTDNFEHYYAPKFASIKKAFGFEMVLLVDDIEALLESGIATDKSGDTSQVVDPHKRSEALTLLERMQDTYKMYLLCTLNHPDVEAAFLRRFNPVYFPLPTPDQRRNMLCEVIQQGPLSDADYTQLVEQLGNSMEGFNYSSMAILPQYVANRQLAIGQDLSPEEYKHLVMDVAFTKTKARTNKEGLARFDTAARTMIGG